MNRLKIYSDLKEHLLNAIVCINMLKSQTKSQIETVKLHQLKEDIKEALAEMEQ